MTDSSYQYAQTTADPSPTSMTPNVILNGITWSVLIKKSQRTSGPIHASLVVDSAAFRPVIDS